MLALTDARFQDGLAAQARAAGKLAADFQPAAALARNTRTALQQTLQPFRREGLLPDYPLGSDFSAEEQRLVKALTWLRSATGSRRGKLATLVRAVLEGMPDDPPAMRRMALQAPTGISERLQSRLLALALRRTRG